MGTSEESKVGLFVDMFAASYPTAISEQMRKLSGSNRAAALEAIRRVAVSTPSLPENLCWTVTHEASRPEYFVLCLEVVDCVAGNAQGKVLEQAVAQVKNSSRLATSKSVQKVIEGLLHSGPEHIKLFLKKSKVTKFFKK